MFRMTAGIWWMFTVAFFFLLLSPFRSWFREARSQLKLPFPLDLTRLSLSLSFD